MLKRIGCSTLSYLLKIPKPSLLLRAQNPTFFFAQVQVPNQLLQTVNQQIKYEEQNKTNLTQYTNFFQNLGWKINYDGILIQLAKKSGSYNIRLLLTAKTPYLQYDQQDQQAKLPTQQDQQSQQLDNTEFTQISSYISKDGGKWLAVDFILAKNQQIQINAAFFIRDYEQLKKQRKSGQISEITYTGPVLESLEEPLQNGLYEWIDNIGINNQILSRASDFSIAYEQQFYIEWLKDLKNLV